MLLRLWNTIAFKVHLSALLRCSIWHTPAAMPAYALPYSPRELVCQCAQAHVPLGQKMAAVVLRRAPQFVLDIIGRYLVEELDRIAMRQSALALEFESLIERVINSPEDKPLDEDDVLYRMLEDLETKQRKSADELSATWSPVTIGNGQRRKAVRLAALRVAGAARAGAAAARNLRGAIQAHDANVSAMQQAMHVCRTPADLDQALGLTQA